MNFRLTFLLRFNLFAAFLLKKKIIFWIVRYFNIIVINKNQCVLLHEIILITWIR